jgi:hypothetical protein
LAWLTFFLLYFFLSVFFLNKFKPVSKLFKQTYKNLENSKWCF